MEILNRFDAVLALGFVDLLLLVFGIEAMLIALWMNRHASVPGVMCNLAAGASLVMALRTAVAQEPLRELALWLMVAGVCHALAMWRSVQAARQDTLPESAEPAQRHPSATTRGVHEAARSLR